MLPYTLFVFYKPIQSPITEHVLTSSGDKQFNYLQSRPDCLIFHILIQCRTNGHLLRHTTFTLIESLESKTVYHLKTILC